MWTDAGITTSLMCFTVNDDADFEDITWDTNVESSLTPPAAKRTYTNVVGLAGSSLLLWLFIILLLGGGGGAAYYFMVIAPTM